MAQEPTNPVDPSTAGEEDPGAGLDASAETSAPGDDAPPGTPGTGEGICPQCGGAGKVDNRTCPACGGTGRVVAAIGGG